jgi:hypothetical protein
LPLADYQPYASNILFPQLRTSATYPATAVSIHVGAGATDRLWLAAGRASLTARAPLQAVVTTYDAFSLPFTAVNVLWSLVAAIKRL